MGLLVKNKINFVFGVTGQIGSYLAEHILGKGERVVGIARRSSSPNRGRLTNCVVDENFTLEDGDLTDISSLQKVFQKYITDPDCEYVVYNLAAQSFVAVSFKEPVTTAEITGLGHLNILESLLPFHNKGFAIKTLFQATSEMFGGRVNENQLQDLNTPFWPNSPYAAAKLYAFHMNRIYRESYKMFNTTGVIFNTESPRRGEEFVTRKITKWFAQFMCNDLKIDENCPKLQLGNVHSYRDWTHAKDTARAVYMIANNVRPKDYVVASGQTHTILEFIQICLDKAKDMLARDGVTCDMGIDEVYEVNQEFFRPNDVSYIKGDAGLIRKDFGWRPEIGFRDLVEEMVQSDYLSAKRDLMVVPEHTTRYS